MSANFLFIKKYLLLVMASCCYCITNSMWIKTSDNHIVQCMQSTIDQSILLSIAAKYFNCKSQERALKLPITHSDYLLLENACTFPSWISRSFFGPSYNQLLLLANNFKCPLLYAQLINILLHDGKEEAIDKKIAHFLFPESRFKQEQINYKEKFVKLSVPAHINRKINGQFTNSGNYFFTDTQLADLSHQYDIWDTKTFTVRKSFNDYDMAQLSPTHDQLVLAKKVKKNLLQSATLIVYNIEANDTMDLDKEEISCIALSHDGKYLAAASMPLTRKGSIHLWDIHNICHNPSYILAKHTKTVDALAFNHTSTHLISGSKENQHSVILWNISNFNAITHQILLSNQSQHFTQFIFDVNNERLTAIGKIRHKKSLYISFNTNQTEFFILPISPKRQLDLNNSQHPDLPHTLLIDFALQRQPYAINDTNTLLAGYDADKIAYIWDISQHNQQQQKIISHTHRTPIQHFHFSKNKLLLTSSANTFCLCDENGNLLKSIAHPHRIITNSFISPNGMQIVTTEKHTKSTKKTVKELLAIYTFNQTKISEYALTTNTSLVTSQAVLLHTLYSSEKNKTEHPFQKNSYNGMALNLFNEIEKDFLTHKFSIKLIN